MPTTQEYIAWLNAHVAGDPYRLPSEAEWEYAAQAGSRTAYPWGPTASHEHANYGADECCYGLASGADEWENTSPVGSFPANAWGLHDMHGNVWERVADCSHLSYANAPTDGSAWLAANGGDCDFRMVRGGAFTPHSPDGRRFLHPLSNDKVYFTIS